MFLSFFKDTDFDFDKLKFEYSKNFIKVDAYFIPSISSCPVCGSSNFVKNGYKVSTIKHCTYISSLFLVKCHIQGYLCKNCHHFFYEKNTFAFPNDSISKESVLAIIDKLKQSNSTFESVAIDLHLNRQNVIDIFDKYITYSPPTVLPEILCFDEKHINKSLTNNAYIFVILDFKTKKVYDILTSRHKFVLEQYFSKISLEKRNNVKYICMDMWDGYIDVARKYFRNAKIVIDSFHVMENINRAMNKVRISVMQKYNKNTVDIEENDPYYYLLKKYRYYFAILLILEKLP